MSRSRGDECRGCGGVGCGACHETGRQGGAGVTPDREAARKAMIASALAEHRMYGRLPYWARLAPELRSLTRPKAKAGRAAGRFLRATR